MKNRHVILSEVENGTLGSCDMDGQAGGGASGKRANQIPERYSLVSLRASSALLRMTAHCRPL